ncbi:MAG: beta-glucuronidase, partial [Paludibacteraceae bacterium]|nr:beta-glucuronidase [Paludibacteraceae bacterium]
MKKLLLSIFALGVLGSSYAENVLQNVYSRECISLNGLWNYQVDPFDNGYYDYRLQPSPNGFFKNQKPKDKTELVEYNLDTAPTMYVPGDWNTQDDMLFYYEGSVWFKRDFEFSKQGDNKTFLYFGAVNYFCNVYLNGEQIGTHEGGFTPFNFDVTDKLKEGKNFLVVRVNNTRKPENVPTVNSDWWNYGGITRDVMLVNVPKVYVDDYSIQMPKGENNRIVGYVQLNEKASRSVVVEIPELKIKQSLQTNADGKAEFSVKAKPTLWSPENPKLYEVTITCGKETIEDKIGFRTIEVQGKKLLVNGKETFLRGISIHEEAPYRAGRVTSREEAVVLLTWAKELGCNFVRLAHYPHNEYMVRAAEEMG